MKGKDNSTQKVLKILLIAFAIGILCTGGMLIYYWHGYSSDRIANDAIREIAYQTTFGDSDNSLESAKESDDKNINFAALSEINSETIGWLSACGDYIDGPIVQTDNNDYYLTHLFDKSKGSAGCFFADTCSRPVFECPLTIIYGHYRKDKSMFYPLHYYKDADYYLENPSFFIYTKEGKKEYHIFSVFYGDYEEDFEELYGYGINSSDSTEDKIKNIFDRAAGKSIYNILSMQPGSEMAENMQLSIGEKNADIVVLYTCEYSGTNNRMFVFGINCD